MPVLMACALIWRERLPARARPFTAAAVAAAAAAGVWLSQRTLHLSAGGHAELFRWIVMIDGPESHPFLNSWAGNALFVGLCLGVFRLRGLPPAQATRVRAIAQLGLAIWLGGGLYLSFAPVALQSPHLALLGVVRMLWWVQYVLYVAYGVWAVARIRDAATWRSVAGAWLLLMALTMIHAEIRWNMGLLIIALTMVAVLPQLRSWASGAGVRPPARQTRARIVAASLCLGVLGLYTVGSWRHRRDDLAYLMRHGVIGNNPSAKWVGVDAYLRAKTPESATVLALSMERHRWSPVALQCDGWLRNRSGRTMPIGPKYNFVLDPEGMRWHQERTRLASELVKRWVERDATGVRRALTALDSPDYLVVPGDQALWLTDGALPYARIAAIRGFEILRRTGDEL
jgi:hypothetical protein